MHSVPETRVRTCNAKDLAPGGDYVLHWMIAARRARFNFALQHAILRARELHKPLVVLEPLRAGYEWASDRLHRFAIDGMADNEARFEGAPILYYPYVEPAPGEGKGLIDALAKHAALVVTDDYPAFFLPRMVRAAAARCPVLMEEVDSNGLLPMRSAGRIFTTARSLRFHLQKVLPEHLAHFPVADPLEGLDLPRLRALPKGIASRWPRASKKLLAGDPGALAALPIDHTVSVSPIRGGAIAGEAALRDFIKKRLARYGEDRNHPDDDASSGLSPYLHWGHLSAHAIFAAVTKRDRWTPRKIVPKVTGLREGWWGASPEVESFLDELVTWREIGFNLCAMRDDYDRFETLPDWALATLRAHEKDPRPHHYTLRDLTAARTRDPIWNAAQRQIVHEGRMHNYLRMLWGKKILEWSKTPEDALAAMIHLNNKYGLDGRDPNSYSGIFWVLGRYDRPWAPERPIFGTVRYMSSDATARKLHLKEYLARWAE